MKMLFDPTVLDEIAATLRIPGVWPVEVVPDPAAT
jgi:hypothetical protein